MSIIKTSVFILKDNTYVSYQYIGYTETKATADVGIGQDIL